MTEIEIIDYMDKLKSINLSAIAVKFKTWFKIDVSNLKNLIIIIYH